VVLGHGEQIQSTRKKMRQITDEISDRYGNFLSDWNGDISVFEGIEEEFNILN
jgi:hypothetical protein